MGASCPVLNGTVNATNGLSMALSVKYGPLPFTITELYTANGTYPGVYKKHVDMPGGQLFVLPTVFVDVTENAAVCDTFVS